MNEFQIDRLITVLENITLAVLDRYFPQADQGDSEEGLNEHIDNLCDDIEMLEEDLADANDYIDALQFQVENN